MSLTLRAVRISRGTLIGFGLLRLIVDLKPSRNPLDPAVPICLSSGGSCPFSSVANPLSGILMWAHATSSPHNAWQRALLSDRMWVGSIIWFSRELCSAYLPDPCILDHSFSMLLVVMPASNVSLLPIANIWAALHHDKCIASSSFPITNLRSYMN